MVFLFWINMCVERRYALFLKTKTFVDMISTISLECRKWQQLPAHGAPGLTLTQPTVYPLRRPLRRKLRISADSIFQKIRIKNLMEGQWGPILKNLTPSPWKRRKTTLSAIFCATGAWGLTFRFKLFWPWQLVGEVEIFAVKLRVTHLDLI